MLRHWFSRLRSRVLVSVIVTGVPMLVMLLALSISGSTQRPLPRVELGLEVLLPGDRTTAIRLIGGGSTLIPRQRLRINDPAAAGQLTAIDLQAEIDGDAIKVTLSVIYNDLSNQEWWKDKQEKFAGSYIIRDGEALRPAELWRFGIEPFEMKAISARPVVFKQGEGPRVTNETTCLEVARLEKHLSGYRIWMKNTSSKNVVAYVVSTGRASIGTGMSGRGDRAIALAAGATSQQLHLDGKDIEQSGITIRFAFFEDGSFEGDPRFATPLLAHEEGVRIQAPHVLSRIELTLEADDTELQAAFDKLEAELWVIPEAIDKPSALDFLRTKFPSLDDKTLSALYEDLKSGLYDARNIALSSMGQTGRIFRERAQNSDVADTAKSLRQVLEHLKQTFVKIVSAHR